MTKLEEAIAQAAREMSRDARVELCHQLMHDLDDVEQKAIEAWRRRSNKSYTKQFAFRNMNESGSRMSCSRR